MKDPCLNTYHRKDIEIIIFHIDVLSPFPKFLLLPSFTKCFSSKKKILQNDSNKNLYRLVKNRQNEYYHSENSSVIIIDVSPVGKSNIAQFPNTTRSLK